MAAARLRDGRWPEPSAERRALADARARDALNGEGRVGHIRKQADHAKLIPEPPLCCCRRCVVTLSCGCALRCEGGGSPLAPGSYKNERLSRIRDALGR